MSLLVDYRCDECGATSERFVASPIPAVADCGACGQPAKRVFGVGGLMGVRLRKVANERLDRERAERSTGATSAAHQGHDHGHHHDHGSHHDHGHGPAPSPDGSPARSPHT